MSQNGDIYFFCAKRRPHINDIFNVAIIFSIFRLQIDLLTSSGYNSGMDKNTHNTKDTFKKICLFIPFVLLAIFIAAMLCGGLLLIFYSIASIVAFDSAMICLILLGAGLIAIGAGCGLICAFKKYRGFYDKKANNIQNEPKKQEKTVVHGSKTFKDYITLSNVALLILLLGGIFTIISAVLGSIKKEEWQSATSSFLTSTGYYETTEHRPLKYSLLEDMDASAVSRIEIDLEGKNAVIIYSNSTSQRGWVNIDYYEKFQNQVAVSRSKNGTITIKENTAPTHDDTAIKKIFFFMFDDNSSQKQVLITLPKSEKDNIKITGDQNTVIIYAK